MHVHGRDQRLGDDRRQLRGRQVGPELPGRHAGVEDLEQEADLRRDGVGELGRVRLGEPARVVPGEVCVESYGDYFTEYASHPEAKAAPPDGGMCMPWTKGVLSPREILATTLVRVGKEANRLAEDPALVDEPREPPMIHNVRGVGFILRAPA